MAQLDLPDSSPDRFLGPARRVALLGFPLEAIATATTGAPQFGAEVRVDLGAGLALGIRPVGVWYLATRSRVAGGGFGVALALHWYFRRPLAGPFVAVQGGDIEAWIGEARGRSYGGAAIFGYALSFANGALVSIGLGLGYWHREGVLAGGIEWPEILSLRLGAGWGWSVGLDDSEPPG